MCAYSMSCVCHVIDAFGCLNSQWDNKVPIYHPEQCLSIQSKQAHELCMVQYVLCTVQCSMFSLKLWVEDILESAGEQSASEVDFI